MDLAQKYSEDSELRYPLMRDAIVAYGSLLKSNKGRTGRKKTFSLQGLESSIPSRLKQIHKLILEHRDTIIAHCDLGPRNPRVCTFGIGFKMAGYRWDDYKKIIPEFQELLIFVQEQLKEHNAEKDLYKKLIRDFEDHPDYYLEDPGPPNTIV